MDVLLTSLCAAADWGTRRAAADAMLALVAHHPAVAEARHSAIHSALHTAFKTASHGVLHSALHGVLHGALHGGRTPPGAPALQP